MDAWLAAHQPWLHGPWGYAVLAGMALVPMVFVASRRSAGFDTYWRMPLHLLGILVLVAALRMAGTFIGLPSERGNSSLNFLFVPAVAFMWAFLRYRSGSQGDTLKRGAVVQDGQQARRDTQRLQKRQGDILTLAGLHVPAEDETKHFKLIGTTGSGKSTAIRELLYQAIKRGDRAIFADPDGGYLSKLYDPRFGDVILNPFDARSAKWNLFLDVDNAYEADLLAKALIPGESEWNSYARTFLAAVVRQCKANGVKDAAELWRFVSVASSDELRGLLQGTAAQPFLEPDNGRMFGSLRSVASNAIAALEYVNAQKGPSFSVREWVRDGKGVLFLPYQAEQIAALKSLIATWMRLAIFQTMSLPEQDNRIWFVVDELDALGHIDGLKDALARIRKFGGRCVLGFQSIAQVSTIYGQGPAKTIVENCSNSLILRCSASEGGGTAQFASALIGKREIIRQTVSTNTEAHRVLSDTVRGYNYGAQHRLEDAVMASEIEALPDRQGFVKFASGAAWDKVNFAYLDVKQQAEPVEAVPLWVSGSGHGSGGLGSGAGRRNSAFPLMPATTFKSSPMLVGPDDNIKRMRGVT